MSAYGALGSEAAEALVMSNFENAFQRRRQYASLLQTQDGGAAAPEGFEAWWEEFKGGAMLKGSYDRMLQDIQSCIWGMTIRSVLRPDAKAALLAAGRGNMTVDTSA